MSDTMAVAIIAAILLNAGGDIDSKSDRDTAVELAVEILEEARLIMEA